jgi:transposase
LDVAIGVDSHKRTVGCAALDGLGRVLDVKEFPNDASGHERALRWIAGHEGNPRVGIEGSGGFGAPLARRLLDAGEDVFEIPAFLTHRERKKAPAKGKSDPSDAVAIARVTARGEGLCSPRRAGLREDVRLLSDERERVVKARTALANQTHADLVVLVPGYEAKVPNLTASKNIAAARRLVENDHCVRAMVVREPRRKLERLRARVGVITTELRRKVDASKTSLTKLRGISFVSAAKILGEVGDSAALRSKAAFAMLTGTAPLEASAGNVKRHRLNRGGNRQLNCVLHRMALTCARSDPETSAYLARHRSMG